MVRRMEALGEKEKDRTLEIWLDELVVAFPLDDTLEDYSFQGLSELLPGSDETIRQFHLRFRTYLGRNLKDIYTTVLVIRDSFLLKNASGIEFRVWDRVINTIDLTRSEGNTLTLEEIQAEVETSLYAPQCI